MRFVLILACLLGVSLSATAAEPSEFVDSTLLAVKGRVEILRSGSQSWDAAVTNLTLRTGDQLRTLETSRATLRLRDATIVNLSELTTLRVAAESSRSVVDLLRGVISFFHRDKPGDAEVRGGSASAIIRGTEFVATVDGANRLTLVMFEGRVDLTNSLGQISASTGEAVTASANEPPQRAPSLAGTNRSAIQWTLYYPAIFDPSELTLPESWNAIVNLYRSGDLWRAANDARDLTPNSDDERTFLAALRLSVGDVPGMESLAGNTRLGAALKTVVSAVQFQPASPPGESSTTELLAASYLFQSQGNIPAALAAARKAAARSAKFGFAHARVAELDFASGHTDAARAALTKALELSPRLASAVALDGFLLAAKGRFAEARARFDQAIALDSGLADAWLGRGLVRFHQGDRSGGRVDLEAAAAIEPQRSVLRSYLGKAFAEESSDTRALSELALAEKLDSNDPTALLYSALIRYRGYELSGAIHDLQESAARNTNRFVFRSRMLLDQDAAVRSANLANIYDLADMPDVARRESARAVMFDYANYSAHLNLAGSFNALRDPTRFNLRNETVWFNEHLLSSLLAPTDAAPLSQNLSQNEYSRLFARDKVGFSSSTEYLSTGEAREFATQFGNFEHFSYALDLDSSFKDGERPNETLSRIEWYSRAKFQITPADSLLVLTKYEDYDSGDNFQYANPALARPNFRFQEWQTPLALAGFHHEWNPGSHTLFLGGRLENEQRLSDQSVPQLVAFTFPASDPATGNFNVNYRNDFVIYSAEASHILESPSHTTILGGRFQKGSFDSTATLDASPLGPALAPLFGGTTTSTGDGDFQRGSFYLYHTWEIVTDLRVTGGASYDNITSPVNFRRPPLQSGEVDADRWSPKFALIYNPCAAATIRGIYAQSLGGVSYDESVTLEPTQLAGFPQAFRTLISESIVGSVETPRHDVGGLALDLKLSSKTYLTLEGTILKSAVDRQIGIFNFDANLPTPGQAASTPDALRYEEKNLRLAASQIFAEQWFGNLEYQFTRAELDQTLPFVPATPTYNRTQHDASDLHRTSASILYQRKDGWFGRASLNFLHQENINTQAPASDDVAQLNLFAGWRFPRLHGDITLGLLNVTGANYHLHPLTPYEEYPRHRAFYSRLRLNF